MYRALSAPIWAVGKPAGVRFGVGVGAEDTNTNANTPRAVILRMNSENSLHKLGLLARTSGASTPTNVVFIIYDIIYLWRNCVITLVVDMWKLQYSKRQVVSETR